jgi:hypothetical protein
MTAGTFIPYTIPVPGSTTSLDVSTSNNELQLDTSYGVNRVYIFNDSASVAFIEIATGIYMPAVASSAYSLPLGPGGRREFSVPEGIFSLAALLASGTGTLYVTGRKLVTSVGNLTWDGTGFKWDNTVLGLTFDQTHV